MFNSSRRNMSHKQTFTFTDQLLRSTGRRSEKFIGTARWSILYQFSEINVSIFLLQGKPAI